MTRPADFLDGVLEAAVVSLDEPHAVERPAIVVRAQPIHRHDSRVFQSAGDLRLQDESLPVVLPVSVLGLNLLQGDLPAEFHVLGDEHLA